MTQPLYSICGGAADVRPDGSLRFASWIALHDGERVWTTDPHDPAITRLPEASAYWLAAAILRHGGYGCEAMPVEGVQAVRLVNDGGKRVAEAISTRLERQRWADVVTVGVILGLCALALTVALIVRLT